MGACGSSSDKKSKKSSPLVAQMRTLIDEAARNKNVFKPNVQKVLELIRRDQTNEAGEAAVQAIAEGIRDPHEQDEHRFWYLLVDSYFDLVFEAYR